MPTPLNGTHTSTTRFELFNQVRTVEAEQNIQASGFDPEPADELGPTQSEVRSRYCRPLSGQHTGTVSGFKVGFSVSVSIHGWRVYELFNETWTHSAL